MCTQFQDSELVSHVRSGRLPAFRLVKFVPRGVQVLRHAKAPRETCLQLRLAHSEMCCQDPHNMLDALLWGVAVFGHHHLMVEHSSHALRVCPVRYTYSLPCVIHGGAQKR